MLVSIQHCLTITSWFLKNVFDSNIFPWLCFSSSTFWYDSFLVQCSIQQGRSMVIYQNGIRMRFSTCQPVRKICSSIELVPMFFFTELIFFQYYQSFFNFFSFKQCSFGRINLTVIYQHGIRIKLQKWERVSIQNYLFYLPIYNKLLNL